ncbi:hypothetical protein DEJ25_13290 [Curtobacterium sp. MCPF17_011]|uniref:hypothetical protein n=1 Tax=Curtobacterium sp. MCPF17_011 TaxID=2175652 RepID=UPI000DAAB389|nr:hypothetical protein [Curtobacterium sp. MCPF17_011]PZF09954.1 hypothetical protein DEJ25_13290 [Curtobacterium sp. MCPF17_011]
MPDVERASALVQHLLDSFDDSTETIASLTRRCQRIASLRGDTAALFWLSLESSDIGNDFENKTEHVRETLAARLLKALPADESERIFKVEYGSYTRRRMLPGNKANYLSVQQTEDLVQTLRREEEATLVPPPPGMHAYDLGKHVAEQGQVRARIFESRAPLEASLARIRDRLWEFLTETEYELTFGEATAETFNRLRSYVDNQLTTISPPALDQFQVAYRRLKDGGNEDRAHALTSCRRVLKTIADELYPASSEPVIGDDGKARVLGDDKFVNRLLQFVSEKVGKHENGAAVQAALKDVGTRLTALNDLASKGVHAKVTTYEVDTCVVQTYLVVADVLRIRERAGRL